MLKGLDWNKYSPAVILVEANDVAALEDFLCPLGYEVIRDFSHNDLLFVRKQCRVTGIP